MAEELSPCGKGSSCADADVQVAGVVPIPLLSLVAFTGIVVALWVARQGARARTRSRSFWATVVAVFVAFVAGVVVFTGRSNQEVKQAIQTNSDALVRPHSPVFGNPAAKVTIVEFLDPSCETCRAYYPIVKRMVNTSFGQVRLVVRYAPLHRGSDTAIKILEAARQQGKYWETLERAMAAQPQWAAHDRPQPELVW